jgi:aldose 1-epimerase
MALPIIGGAPVLRLTAPAGEGARLIHADIAPGRGMMLLQATAAIPHLGEIDILAAPSMSVAAERLDGGADDFAGNAAFAFGGAILAPYANRIRGKFDPDKRAIETPILGRTIALPANWGGKAAGAEAYAMHGLILDRAVDQLEVAPDGASATGVILAGDFGQGWPGDITLAITWRLWPRALTLTIKAVNRGEEPSPIGLGWHPYLALPSGRREQARLTLPAKSRVVVNNYDEVLPTGDLAPVAGSIYDFTRGAALADLYLDDCFTDLIRTDDGEIVVEVADPAARYAVRVASPSSHVTAVQTYAPPDQPFVVVEPQFNLANPYGAEWQGRDTGMVVLRPGETTTYDARIELHG